MTPDIYVAVPVYRGTEHIAETVASIRSQTYENFRVVMSVDGADDPTVDMCRTFTADERFVVNVQPKRLGWPGNFNWLANDCDTEFFCYWQQDDLATPDYLHHLRATMRATPGASVAYADVQWFGTRTDRVTAVDIDGTPLQRFLQAAEALQYVPLRGLIRASHLPERSDPIPTRPEGQPHQDFVFLAELAGAGAFRRVDTPIYYKRAHSSSAHHGWSSDPGAQRRLEWCALGDGLLAAAVRTDPAVDVHRLVTVVLDRLAVDRSGRGFWYLPEQSELGVSAFVREFFYRYPHWLAELAASDTRCTTGFERPVHRWVHAAVAAVERAPATADLLVETSDSSTTLTFEAGSPSVWILGHGWSTPESWGVWTDAEEAELRLPPHTFRRAVVSGHPFSPDGAVTVRVSAGDAVVEHCCDGTTAIAIELATDGTGEHHRVIRFQTPDSVSPHDAGVGADARRLGFGLCALTLER